MKQQILAGLAAAAMLAGGIAFTTVVPASANDGDGEQVPPTPAVLADASTTTPWTPPQYPPFDPEPCVEYRFEKSTSTWSAATGTWSAWTDWPGAGPLAWGVVPNPRTGHHFGTHGADGDRDYAYVVVDQRPITSGDCNPQPPIWAPPEYPPFNPQPCVEYRLEKSTSTWSAATGTWSAWTDSLGAGPLDWGVVPNPRTGHHGGTHEADGDRHFAYVVIDQRPVTTGDCRPPQPPDEVVRVHTCDEPGVVYVTTTPYVWDEKTSTWVPGTPVVTTEPATEEQIESCTPEPKVTVTEWKDEEIVCDATTVTQTRTVTTTPYVWDPTTSTFVPDEANATSVTETRTRPLEPDEIVPCPTEPPTTEPPTTEPPTTEPPTTEPPTVPPTVPPVTQPPTVPPTAPATTVAILPPAPTTSTTQPPTVTPGLPATGSNSTGITVVFALLATALGGAALIIARRRNAAG